jgi:hypothetical protein
MVASTVAASAVTRVARIAEATWATTPATPAFKNLRVIDAGIQTNKTVKPIMELAVHRNVMDEVQAFQAAGASYKFALSYGSFDDVMADALFGAWTSDVLVNGIVRNSATYEETLQLNGALSFSRLTGGMVDSFDINIASQSEITGGFSVKGQKETLDTAIIASATYVASNTKQVMSTGVSVAALAVASLVTPKVKSLSLQIKNSLRERPVIDSLYSIALGESLIDVTGTIELYFFDNAHYQKVLDHGGGDLTFTLGQTTLEKYLFDMPSIVFLDGKRNVGGVGNDVLVSIPFRAKYDGTKSMQITRAVV